MCYQVRVLFTVAHCLQPAVIFIDEIDSLLSARKSEGAPASQRTQAAPQDRIDVAFRLFLRAKLCSIYDQSLWATLPIPSIPRAGPRGANVTPVRNQVSSPNP